MVWGKSTPQLMQEEMAKQARYQRLTPEQIEEIEVERADRQTGFEKDKVKESIGVAQAAMAVLESALNQQKRTNIEKGIKEPFETVDSGLRHQYMAQLVGLLLDLKTGATFNNVQGFDVRQVKGLEEMLIKFNPSLQATKSIIYNRSALIKRLKTNPELADLAGVDEENLIEELDKLADLSGELTPAQNTLYGLALGFPADAIKDYLREQELINDKEIPTASLFYWLSNPREDIYNIKNFSEADKSILEEMSKLRQANSQKLEDSDLFDHWRMNSKQEADLVTRYRSTIERWYQEYYGLNQAEAKFLASRHTESMFIDGLAHPVIVYIGYEDNDSAKELRGRFEQVNKLLE